MRFLSEDQPACACPDPIHRLRHELQAALGHLLELLKAGGVVLQYPARKSAIEQELTRFEAHMRDVWDWRTTRVGSVAEWSKDFLSSISTSSPSPWRPSAPHPSAASSLANRGEGPPPSPRMASSLAAISASAACPATGGRTEGRDPQGRTLAVGITA